MLLAPRPTLATNRLRFLSREGSQLCRPLLLGKNRRLNVPVRRSRVVTSYAAYPTLKHHIVRRGDTLSSIASQYGTTVKDIIKANKAPLSAQLNVNTKVIIPAGSAEVKPSLTASAGSLASGQPAAARASLPPTVSAATVSAAPITTTAAPPPPSPNPGTTPYTALGVLSLLAFGMGMMSTKLFSSNKTARRPPPSPTGEAHHQPHIPPVRPQVGVLYEQHGADKGAGRRILTEGGSRTESATVLLQSAEDCCHEGGREAAALARSHATQALHIAADVADPRIEMQAYGVLSEICEVQGDYAASKEYASHALELATLLGDRQLQMMALLAKGNACSRLGDLQAAVVHQEKALDLARALNDAATEGRCYGALGYSYHALGRPEAATDYMGRSQKMFLSIGDLDALAVSYTHTAEAMMMNGETSTALQYLVKALEISQRLGNLDMQQTIITTIKRNSHGSPYGRAIIETLSEEYNVAPQR
mmetsp:Transcript_31553/g.68962  ORF Transcript_31553/g.68962 Transcript_31553/m.68962 type:complete len:478 (-) Transcript_31553:1425-2858(-)